MAEDKNKFQSIYGDAESEFEAEDVSDETLSISKEDLEAEIARKEEPTEVSETPETAPVEEAAEENEPVKEDAAAEPPVEETAPADMAEPADDSAPEVRIVDHTEELRDHHDHTDDDPDPDNVYGDHDEEETEAPEDDKVSVISYILHAILFTIPVIGTIIMLVYIISDKKNSHLRHFAQIWLVTLLLIAIGAWAALTILGIA